MMVKQRIDVLIRLQNNGGKKGHILYAKIHITSSFGLRLQVEGVQECGIVIPPKHCRRLRNSTLTEGQDQRETWVRQ
jgi:hypothetical protein